MSPTHLSPSQHYPIPGSWRLQHPTKEELEMFVETKVNLTGDLTKEILNKIIFHEIGANNVEKVWLLCDYFKGHSKQCVKGLVKSLDCSWKIMAGYTTPVCQSLYWLLNKLFKGKYHGLCDHWMVTAPINQKIGYPISPSHQLCAQFEVLAWEKIPDAVVGKAWTGCGYKYL